MISLLYFGVSTKCCVSVSRHECRYGKYWFVRRGQKVILFLLFANNTIIRNSNVCCANLFVVVKTDTSIIIT